MSVKGGNTTIYQGDGRLRMARSLERAWPGVVTTKRRFNRPQHVVKDSWVRFDTPLKRRADVDFSKLDSGKYKFKLQQVKPQIKSEKIRKMLKEYDGR